MADTSASENEGEPDLRGRLALVRARIAEAAAAAGRDPAELTVIAVTKFHDASMLRELSTLGLTDFGESRHQEAREKAAELEGLGVTWHFVGQVQGKKARQVAEYATVIHSLDRASLADQLATARRVEEGGSIDVFLQVNLTDDPGRGGVAPAGIEALAEHVASVEGLRMLGVMAVAPLGEPPRAAFARLRSISDTVARSFPEANAISAGMSNDFADAIAEGATHLRIGTAITGIRPAAG